MDLDHLVEIFTHQNVPARHQRGGGGAEIGKDQSAQLFDRIGLDSDLLLVGILRQRAIFERLFEASSIGIKKPAVVRAAQPSLLRDPVFQRKTSMRAALADEPVLAAFRSIEREVLAKDS